MATSAKATRAMTETARESARERAQEAHRAADAAEAEAHRLSAIARFGTSDPLVQMEAQESLLARRREAIQLRRAADAAKRELLAIVEADADARAPHYRREVEQLVAGLDAKLGEVVELTDRLEAVGQQAAADCRVAGRWAGGARAPYDRSLAEVGAHVRSLRVPWRARLQRAGWLSTES